MNQKINKGQKQTKALIILLVIAVGVIAIGIIGNYVSIAKSPSVVLPGFKAKGDPIWRNIVKCSPELIDSAEITTVSDSKNMDLF